MDSQHPIHNDVFEAIQREKNGQPLSPEERAALCEKLRINEGLDGAPDEELYGVYVLGAAKHRKHWR